MLCFYGTRLRLDRIWDVGCDRPFLLWSFLRGRDISRRPGCLGDRHRYVNTAPVVYAGSRRRHKGIQADSIVQAQQAKPNMCPGI